MKHANGEDLRFPNAAYRFLLDALEGTRRRLRRDGHVSGQEILKGIEALAGELYGPTTAMVFENWGIRDGNDFGFMVFELVDRGVLSSRDEDRIEDFAGGGTYEQIFEERYFENGETESPEKKSKGDS